MSTFYKIGEIASLYNISTDILRYYEELGILVPRRTRTYVPQLLAFAREHSMNIRGPLLELLWIDVHTTKHVEEQVTELQLKVALP